jgi:hypothetical protein
MPDLLEDIQSFLDGLNEGRAEPNSYNVVPRPSVEAGFFNVGSASRNTKASDIDDFGVISFMQLCCCEPADETCDGADRALLHDAEMSFPVKATSRSSQSQYFGEGATASGLSINRHGFAQQPETPPQRRPSFGLCEWIDSPRFRRRWKLFVKRWTVYSEICLQTSR